MMNWLTGSKHAEARKLVNQLKDASKQDRAGAELLRMGKDPDRDVQKQAIQSLGALKDSRSISALQAIAVDHRDREMSALAREAISTVTVN
jgi:HEAT repeat protein